MRLDDQQQSRNIEDRRGMSGGRGRGRSPLGGGGRKIGLGTIVLALAAWYFFGVNPMTILGGGDIMGSLTGAGSAQTYETTGKTGAEMTDAEGIFVSKVLKTTETVWERIFRENGWGQYPQPRLVLYSGLTPTACGTGQAQMGPFYCPADQKVYIDLSFFRDTGRRLGVKGDFAQGYVIAHEVGHHVQNRLGILDQVNRARQSNSRQANQVSVMSELQADCFAGLWAHQLHREGQVIEPGDIEEAMNAAAAVGDDRIQKSQRGYAVPDSFTHGSSEQRVAWFTRGLQSGNIQQCDPFRG